MKHFRLLIEMFGAPNGLCSSITESKHIKAVKEPYRRSSHFEALGQMLLTNQRIDKLAACRINLTARNMLDGPCLAPGIVPIIPMLPLPPHPRHDPDDDAVDGPRAVTSISLARTQGKSMFVVRSVILMVFFSRRVSPESDLALQIDQPDLLYHIRRFLFSQHNPDAPFPIRDQDILLSTIFNDKISVFHSATATYYAPSDHSSIYGMLKQCI